MSNDDQRIPIRIGSAVDARRGSYVLAVSEIGDAPGPARHTEGWCACCAPRGALARALTRLFLARMRGEVPYFGEIVLTMEGAEAALAAAFDADVMTAARFRHVSEPEDLAR